VDAVGRHLPTHTILFAVNRRAKLIILATLNRLHLIVSPLAVRSIYQIYKSRGSRFSLYKMGSGLEWTFSHGDLCMISKPWTFGPNAYVMMLGVYFWAYDMLTHDDHLLYVGEQRMRCAHCDRSSMSIVLLFIDTLDHGYGGRLTRL